MDAPGLHRPTALRGPAGSVVLVLGGALTVAAVAGALIDGSYCTDHELRLGALGWMLAMAPVVLITAAVGAGLVTSISPDGAGLIAWLAVLVAVALGAGLGYAVGQVRWGCDADSAGSVVAFAGVAAAPGALIGGILGWIRGVRRGR